MNSLAVLFLASFSAGNGLAATLPSGPGCDAASSQPLSYSVDAVDARPTPVASETPPHSPHGLAMQGVTGEVRLAFTVDTAGAVDPCSIRILQEGHPQLAAPALAYIRGRRFIPGRKEGVAVRTRLEETLSFRERNGDRGRHHLF
jgi:TonB family protein